MARLFGLVLAGGLVLGAASESKAQFALSIGNPYYGGYGVGGYGYGYPGFAYSSGYMGMAPMGMGYGGYGYGMPAYGYGGVYRSYAYRPFYGGYGVRRGWGWGGRRWRRW